MRQNKLALNLPLFFTTKSFAVKASTFLKVNFLVKKELERISDQLEAIQKTMLGLYEAQVQVSSLLAFEQEQSEKKRSVGLFYFGIFWGVLTGLLGNYFVSFIFVLSEPSTEMAVAGLIVSATTIVIICTVLWRKIGKFIP